MERKTIGKIIMIGAGALFLLVILSRFKFSTLSWAVIGIIILIVGGHYGINKLISGGRRRGGGGGPGEASRLDEELLRL
jgi:hypothetical protein